MKYSRELNVALMKFSLHESIQKSLRTGQDTKQNMKNEIDYHERSTIAYKSYIIDVIKPIK